MASSNMGIIVMLVMIALLIILVIIIGVASVLIHLIRDAISSIILEIRDKRQGTCG